VINESQLLFSITEILQKYELSEETEDLISCVTWILATVFKTINKEHEKLSMIIEVALDFIGKVKPGKFEKVDLDIIWTLNYIQDLKSSFTSALVSQNLPFKFSFFYINKAIEGQ